MPVTVPISVNDVSVPLELDFGERRWMAPQGFPKSSFPIIADYEGSVTSSTATKRSGRLS
jgi:hypothetical protein